MWIDDACTACCVAEQESQTSGQMRVPDHNIPDIVFSASFGPVGLRHLLWSGSLPSRRSQVVGARWLESPRSHSDAKDVQDFLCIVAGRCQQVVPSSGSDLSGAVWSLGSLVGPDPTRDPGPTRLTNPPCRTKKAAVGSLFDVASPTASAPSAACSPPAIGLSSALSSRL